MNKRYLFTLLSIFSILAITALLSVILGFVLWDSHWSYRYDLKTGFVFQSNTLTASDLSHTIIDYIGVEGFNVLLYVSVPAMILRISYYGEHKIDNTVDPDVDIFIRDMKSLTSPPYDTAITRHLKYDPIFFYHHNTLVFTHIR